MICKFIRTPWFRYRTQPDMYGSGGQGMKWKLFTESWQRMRVFRMAEGDSGREMPPKRERAIVYYMRACVHYNSERRPRSNFRKTRISRRDSGKTFLNGRNGPQIVQGEQGTEASSRSTLALPATYSPNTPPSPVHAQLDASAAPRTPAF